MLHMHTHSLPYGSDTILHIIISTWLWPLCSRQLTHTQNQLKSLASAPGARALDHNTVYDPRKHTRRHQTGSAATASVPSRAELFAPPMRCCGVLPFAGMRARVASQPSFREATRRPPSKLRSPVSRRARSSSTSTLRPFGRAHTVNGKHFHIAVARGCSRVRARCTHANRTHTLERI